MDASHLIDQLQQLDREEKLKVFQQLAEDLSVDLDPYFAGRRVYKIVPPIRATEQALRQLSDNEH